VAYTRERFIKKPAGVINSFKAGDYLLPGISWLQFFKPLDGTDGKYGLNHKSFF